MEAEIASKLTSINNELEAIKKEESPIHENIAKAKAVAMQEQDKLIAYNTLQREVETNQELYQSLLQRLKAISGAANNIIIIDKAQVPLRKPKPGLLTNLAFGSLLGLLLGISVAVLRAFMDDRVEDVAELELTSPRCTAAMHDIFISYSRQDKTWVDTLATVLTAQGYAVWWDAELLPGQNFENAIKQVLDNARCVVTVWSTASVGSLWVREESSYALQRHVLIPILYQPAVVPMPFGRIHTADLQGWQGEVNDLRFQQLLKAIAQYCPKPVETEHDATEESPARLAPTPTADVIAPFPDKERVGDGVLRTTLRRVTPHWKWLSAATLTIFALAGGYNDLKQVWQEFTSPTLLLDYEPKENIHAGDTIYLTFSGSHEGYATLWNQDASGTVTKLLPEKGSATLHFTPQYNGETIGLQAKTGNGTDKFILLWTPEDKPDHLGYSEYDTEAAFSVALKKLEADGVKKQEVTIPVYQANP